MKKFFSLTMALLLSLAFAGIASAEEYLVQRGECLSQIGQKVEAPWRMIAQANEINSPYLIREKQKLQIPEKEKKVAQATQTTPAQKAVATDQKTEKAKVLNDTLGDRVDSLFKWTHREGISDKAHKHVNLLYGSLDVYPFKVESNYFGLGGTYLGVEGKTAKGFPFDTRFGFLGPRYKWFPKDSGHEFGVGFSFGYKDDGKKSRSATLAEIYYTNTQRKLAGESTFSEWTVWGSLISSDTQSFSFGGRLYLVDGESWRLFAEAKVDAENPNSAVAVGIGVTDSRNIIEVGAGLRAGTQGVEWWVGPAIKPDNLLNGVVLRPVKDVVEITPDGIKPLIAKTDSSSELQNGFSFDPSKVKTDLKV